MPLMRRPLQRGSFVKECRSIVCHRGPCAAQSRSEGAGGRGLTGACTVYYLSLPFKTNVSPAKRQTQAAQMGLSVATETTQGLGVPGTQLPLRKLEVPHSERESSVDNQQAPPFPIGGDPMF